MTMFVTKPKKELMRVYPCYQCSCTGFRPVKRLFFKVLNWEVKIKKKEICYSCSGKGIINSYRVFGTEYNLRSFLEH